MQEIHESKDYGCLLQKKKKKAAIFWLLHIYTPKGKNYEELKLKRFKDILGKY